ncbi:hypothetical protein ACFLZY_02120 [Patescibacteria group bacterium]
MGKKHQGFCTTFAIELEKFLYQARPRRLPNGNLYVNSFPQYSEEEIVNEWVPGRMIRFDYLGPVQDFCRRLTHPEDVLINLRSATLLETRLTDQSLIDLVEPFTFPGLCLLFPQLLTENGKGFVHDGQTLQRSVGYVVCPEVRIGYYQKADITDGQGFKVSCPIKDREMLSEIETGELEPGDYYKNCLCRFSLAGGFAGSDGQFDPPRCYLQLSHVISL